MSTVKEALEVLKRAFENDPSYAQTWHANLAMCFKDEGCEHGAAQLGATRFMKLAFGVQCENSNT